MGWSGSWLTDPALIDGGLQLAVLYAERQLGGASLPTGFQSFLREGDAPPRGQYQCEVRLRQKSRDKIICDISFFTDRQKPLARLSGVEVHLRPDVRVIAAP
jgi:hypothetical protein